MKPFPKPEPLAQPDRPRFPSMLPVQHTAADLSAHNQRRVPANPINRAYPWLLLASTTIASLFCFLYIAKPVVQTSPSILSAVPQPDAPAKPETPAAASGTAEPSAGLLPGKDRLPGDPAPPQAPAPLAKFPVFEETNLSVQHVLTAQAPAGDLCRIVLDVPVLYQSRHFRWNEADVLQARELLGRLADYQEKSVALKSEATALLNDWNHLVSRSIPSSELRADSPTLPANQRDAAPLVVPAGLNTGEAIQLKPAAK